MDGRQTNPVFVLLKPNPLLPPRPRKLTWDNAALKIMLATGTIVGYAYGTEFFIAWYSGNPFALRVMTGPAPAAESWL